MADFAARWTATACLALWSALPAVAAGAGDEGDHRGVASCAGSTCHGSTRPFAGSRISQNEYLVWQREDRHARAFTTLRGDASARIAEKLGLARATEAGECLVCHAPASRLRAPGHQLADGVGCEACHGAAGGWLAGHTAGYASHAERLKAGLYPLWQPDALASRCLGCHQGDAQHPMTHRLLGAGHPPLRFELDTYLAVMPPHEVEDADYLQRKGPGQGARNWIEGQVAAAALQLRNLRAEEGQGGRFPELASYDCTACHHSLKDPRWQAGIAGSLAPGSVRLADAALFQLGIWLDVIDAPLAQRWRSSLGRLHEASTANPPAMVAPLQALQSLLEESVRPRLKAAPLRADQLYEVLARLLAAHHSGPSGSDFSRAEQLAMAGAVLFTDLEERRHVRVTAQWKSALDALYAAIGDRDRFKPEELRRAAARAEAALRAAVLKK